MASSLRLVTSNRLISTSVFPVAVSSSPFLSHIGSHRRSYATMPIVDDFFDQSWLRSQMSLWRQISSMSVHMEKTAKGSRSLTLDIPGLEKMETNEEGRLCVSLDMPGLKKEDMKACVEHNTLFIQGKTQNECYLTGIKLTSCTTTDHMIKEEIRDGMLKVTLPNYQEEFAATFGPWPYSDMFSDRSILGKGLCPVIGGMLSPINSFSIYKNETAKSMHINISMPGLEKIELTRQGVRVSLDMPGLKREDVKSFFDYGTFFIEGKTIKEHYITGIHLPEDIPKDHNMSKIGMKGGMIHATIPIPCVKDDEDLS